MGVYFLGLFDCVNSVGQFEILMFRKSYNHVATPPAKYIRHAVSIHERRLKFKPALFLMDDATPVPGVNTDISDVKEVWFAGQHGDVGGGWMLAEHQRHLLSDTPLEWMLQEVKTVPDADQLAFRKQPVVQDIVHATEDGLGLVRSLRHGELSNHELRVLTNQPHDMLAFNRGATWFATLQWWILGMQFFSCPFFSHRYSLLTYLPPQKFSLSLGSNLKTANGSRDTGPQIWAGGETSLIMQLFTLL